MTSNRLRGLLLCVSGMVAFCLFSQLALLLYPYFADPAGKAGYGDFLGTQHSFSPAVIVSSAAGFVTMMSVQRRFRTEARRHDQDGRTVAWVLPAMFVLGFALCAAVLWTTFLWASGWPA